MKKSLVILMLLVLSPLFSYSQEYKILHDFYNDNINICPTGQMLIINNKLYGMTILGGKYAEGTIYCINVDGTNFKTIYSFNRESGSTPYGSLSYDGEYFYGATYYGGSGDLGTIFRIGIDGSGYKTLYEFKSILSDGAHPLGSLLLSDSVFYGTTQRGGIENRGAAFKINIDGTGFSLLHSFQLDSSGPLVNSSLIELNNRLFGIARYSIFSMKKDGSDFRIHKYFGIFSEETFISYSSLSCSGKTLYGTCMFYDSVYTDKIFRFNTDENEFGIIHTFKVDSSEGFEPTQYLSAIRSKLFGLTHSGGKYNRGTIYCINTNGTNFRLIHSFVNDSTDGQCPYPLGGLVNTNSEIIGATVGGGEFGDGTIFSLSYAGLWDSCGSDSFEYPDFSSKDKIFINGQAAPNPKTIRLTSTEANLTGAMYRDEPVRVSGGFRTEFSFRFSEGHNAWKDGSPDGADGLAFVIQAADTKTKGTFGGGIGYSGIPNSIAFEFDAYNNDEDLGEDNGSHTAIFSNGKGANSSDHSSGAEIVYTENIPLLKADSSIYYAKIEYHTDTKTMTVWIDKYGNYDTPVIEAEIGGLEELLDLFDGGKAYIGFTSATGTSYQNTDLLSWSFCNFVDNPGSTDVKEYANDNKSDIIIAPNPANDYIEIHTAGHKINSDEINIYNAIGERVLVYHTLQNANKIDISNLPKGFYYLKIGNLVEKFVKI